MITDWIRGGIDDLRDLRGPVPDRRARRLWMSRADRHRWEAAASLADVADLTAEWLEGGIESQPGYQPGYGPDPETAGLVDVLAAVNRAGLLTSCSQPGSQGSGYDGRWWQQRAGVQLQAVHGLADQFAASLAGTGLTVIHHRVGPASSELEVTGPAETVAVDGEIVVTTRDGQAMTSFGSIESADSIEFRYDLLENDALDEILLADQLAVIDTQWGRDSLLWPALAHAAGQLPVAVPA